MKNNLKGKEHELRATYMNGKWVELSWRQGCLKP